MRTGKQYVDRFLCRCETNILQGKFQLRIAVGHNFIIRYKQFQAVIAFGLGSDGLLRNLFVAIE